MKENITVNLEDSQKRTIENLMKNSPSGMSRNQFVRELLDIGIREKLKEYYENNHKGKNQK